MGNRTIKTQVKCMGCRKWRFWTSYHEGANLMLCKRCLKLVEFEPNFFKRKKKRDE